MSDQIEKDNIGEVLGVSAAWLQFGFADIEKLTTDDFKLAIKMHDLSPSDRKLLESKVDKLSKNK